MTSRRPSRSRRRPTDAPEPAPPGYALRVALWRVRRAAPVLVVALLALGATRALAAPDGPTTTVAVLARDVPAGRALDVGDVRAVRVPSALAPDGAVRDPDDVTGVELLVDLGRGTPLVEGVLARGRFGVEPPDGTVVVPLELAGGTSLLRPGDRVDVVARTEGTGPDEVLAAGALVLSVDAGASDAGSSLLGTPGATGPVVTVVAVPPEEGRRLVARAGWDPLGAVLVP